MDFFFCFVFTKNLQISPRPRTWVPMGPPKSKLGFPGHTDADRPVSLHWTPNPRLLGSKEKGSRLPARNRKAPGFGGVCGAANLTHADSVHTADGGGTAREPTSPISLSTPQEQLTCVFASVRYQALSSSEIGPSLLNALFLPGTRASWLAGIRASAQVGEPCTGRSSRLRHPKFSRCTCAPHFPAARPQGLRPEGGGIRGLWEYAARPPSLYTHRVWYFFVLFSGSLAWGEDKHKGKNRPSLF